MLDFIKNVKCKSDNLRSPKHFNTARCLEIQSQEETCTIKKIMCSYPFCYFVPCDVCFGRVARLLSSDYSFLSRG